MKHLNIFPFLFAATITLMVMLMSCNSVQNSSGSIALGDTLTTASGVKYLYLVKGTGRKVEPNCEVKTYLSLRVNDSVVWTSKDSPDSLFTFVAGFSRLISGFTEVSMLLSEGDQIIAILPDSLAYGAKGVPGVIPPHATLLYDKFIVVKVDEPKALLADTLYAVLQSQGNDVMMQRYNQICSTSDSIQYHKGAEQISGLCDRLMKEEQYLSALNTANCFAELLKDDGLRFRAVLAMEKTGNLSVAIDSLQLLVNRHPDNTRWKSKLDEMKK